MASFTVTAASGKFTADHTAFVCGFDLTHANVPAGFWTDVDEGGGNIRVFDGETRLPVDVYWCNPTSETGWIFFRSDVLTGSDNEFTVDTDETTPQGPTDTYGRYNVWQDCETVHLIGHDPHDRARDETLRYISTTAGRPSGFAVDGSAATHDSHDGAVYGKDDFYYGFDTTVLRKFNSSWMQVDSNATVVADSGFTGAEQIEAGDAYGGVIYVVLNDGDAGGQRWIGMYDTSDLSFIDGFEITDLGGAGVGVLTVACYYNPEDELLYVVRYIASPGDDEILKYDPVAETYEGAIALSDPLIQMQGIVKWRDAFWITHGASSEFFVARVDPDGTVSNEFAIRTGIDTVQAISVALDNDGLLVSKSGVGVDPKIDTATVFRPLTLDLSGDGGIDINSLTAAPAERGVADLASTGALGTSWLVGFSFRTDDDAQDALVCLTETGTGFSTNVHIANRSGNNLGMWDGSNSWQHPSTGLNPATDGTIYRCHVYYDGTTERAIYWNGGNKGTDSTITARGANVSHLSLGSSREGSNSESLNGAIGFVYARPSIPTNVDEWVADEYSLLNDNAAFWTVAEPEPEGEPPGRAKVGVKKRHKDSVDIWTTPFVPGEEGDTHGATQYEITTDDDPDFLDPIWQSGDDTVNLTIYNRAGKELPLPAQTGLRVRARHKGLPSGLYGEWSDDDAGDQDGGVEFATVSTPPELFLRKMQLRPFWLGPLGLDMHSSGSD